MRVAQLTPDLIADSMRIVRLWSLKEWCEVCVPDAHRQYNQIRPTFANLRNGAGTGGKWS